MSRQSLARLALRAYPAEVLEHGEAEMLSTTLEMGEGSNSAFARELGSVVLGGLRSRGHQTARSGTRRIIIDACVVSLVIMLGLFVWDSARQVIAGPGPAPALELLFWGELALFLTGYASAAGVIGALVIAVAVSDVIVNKVGGTAEQFSPLAVIGVPLVCCLVVASDSRARPRHHWRALLLVAIFALGLLLPPQGPGRVILHGGSPGPQLNYEELILVVISAIGLLRLPYDPRLALGAGLIWASGAARDLYGALFIGMGDHQTLEVWIAALLLALALTRVALMRWRVVR